jgi:hypothetical protein
MDDVAAPQAAGTSGDQDALDRLRYGWGDAYRIDWDPSRGWQARRRDGIGGDITAASPDKLWAKVVNDYTRRPVPRNLGTSQEVLP